MQKAMLETTTLRRLATAGWAAATLLGVGHALAEAEVVFGAARAVSASDGRAMAPDIGVGTDGSVHVLWIDKAPPPPEARSPETTAPAAAGQKAPPNHAANDELYYRRSPPGAEAFGPAVRVNREAGDVWGFAVSKPELAIGRDGIIHVMYPANGTQAATGKAVLVARYTRSTDGGRSFEPGRTLNSPAKNDLSAVMHGGFAAAHAFGTLATAGDDDVHVYWIDTRFMGEKDPAAALFAAVSRDGGKTFGPDAAVYRNEVCPCCQLAAVAMGPDILLASRMTYPEGFRDSTVAVSGNMGASYGERVRLGEGRWKIDGCPLKRTAIAAAGGNVYTAWYTAGQEPAGVYFARSVDGGRTYEPSVAMHPAAAVSDAPSVAATSDGKVYVAWHGKTGSGRRVFLRVSSDRSASFAPVAEVPAPAGTAAYPEIVAAPDGSAYLAWQQEQVAYVMRVTATTVAAAAATR